MNNPAKHAMASTRTIFCAHFVSQGQSLNLQPVSTSNNL